MRATGVLLIALSALGGLEAQQYTISTFAGGAFPPTPIAAAQTAIGLPSGVAADAAGNMYFSSIHCVFRVDSKGVMTRIAGNAHPGYAGDGGPAASAELQYPQGIAVDASGNLFIADAGNFRVRKVSQSGIITTVAGNGISGYAGDGGAAVNAEFWAPESVAVDAGGNLYISDLGNYRIRKVSPSGIITTWAGNGSTGGASEGSLATSSRLDGLFGVTADASGNLFLTDDNFTAGSRPRES